MSRTSVVAARTSFVVAVAAFVLVFSNGTQPTRAATGERQVAQEVRNRALRAGRVRVIVEVARPDHAGQILGMLPAGSHRIIRRHRRVPFVTLDVTPAGLDALETLGPDVVRVMEDRILRPVLGARLGDAERAPSRRAARAILLRGGCVFAGEAGLLGACSRFSGTLLAESVPLIQGDQVWASGYDGSGTMIAVLDTGVDATHPFLAGKVTAEACFSTTVANTSETFCPNGLDQQIGPGAGAPCPLPDCLHGTHVAGIAAGHDATGAHAASGVASGAQVMAIQVFSKITDAASCGGVAPCLGGFSSDIIAALEHVYASATAGTYNIAAVNMSIGENLYEAPCDSTPYKPIIDNLRAIGIPSVAAAGNDGWPFGLSAPACVSSAVSVGGTTKTDDVAWFSNVAPFLSLFAPGDAITSSVPGGTYESLSGTSMAAPHVAGVWGLMKQAAPTASVSTILSALQTAGRPITDTRYGSIFGDGSTIPRVNVYDALGTLVPLTAPVPTIATLSPASAPAGFGPFTMTISGSGFTSRTSVEWNGLARPTTLINSTKVEASIGASDVAAVGTALVRVTTSPPGGGTTSALTFSINLPPSLTVSAPVVAPGESATVTLVDGVGGSSDWLALAASGAADSSYLTSTLVGAGVTNRTWTVAMPATGGTYEFRLFVNNTRLATSPPVTVDPAYSPVPIATSLSPSTVVGGISGLTLTVTGSKFVTSSVVRWNGANRPTTFVGATQLRATIGAGDIAAPGSAQITVFSPAPGGGVSAPLTITIDPPPVLTVSATSVAAGASVTVSLTNGRGAPQDWITLASTGTPDTSYLQWTYVGAGVTSRTWTVTLPPTLGSYEFRLLLDNGYVRAATSPTITVVAGGPPALTVDAPTVLPGGQVTVTLTNGAGGASDWLAFAAASAANSSYVYYTYVGAGIVTRTWTVTAPATPGTYEFRLFLNNGYTRAATSAAITVPIPPAAPPSVASLSPRAAPAGGAAFTLTVNGSGFTTASVVRWNGVDRTTTYQSASRLRASIPATDLTTLGTAQVTVFTAPPGGGLSAALPFDIAPPPVLTVNATTLTGGTPGTVTVTQGFGGASDWLALAAASAPNTSYVQYIYVGEGVTTRTWTVTMPTTPGTYEFRLFLNDGYTRAATSPPITVTPAPNPVPVVSALSPARFVVGGPGTVTVNGSGFVRSSTVRWNNLDRPTTFVSATQLTASISAADVAAVGTAQVSVASPAPGGGVSAALPLEIAPPPVLAVDSITAARGAQVTVTLTGGAGGTTDWFALASLGAPDTSYLQWTYVGAGVTTRTWTVTMPSTPGTYEFRLFLNNGYVRVATSPTITVF